MSVSGKQVMRLGDVKAPGTDFDPDSDYLQLLDPNTTETTERYVYVSKEVADSWGEPGECDDYIGWWDLGGYESGPSRNGVAVQPGATFLLANRNGHSMTFKYKSALDVTKPVEEDK